MRKEKMLKALLLLLLLEKRMVLEKMRRVMRNLDQQKMMMI